MRTDADERRDSALEHLTSTIQHLKAVVVDECPGSDEYNETYRLTMRNVFNTLLNMRDQLKS